MYLVTFQASLTAVHETWIESGPPDRRKDIFSWIVSLNSVKTSKPPEETSSYIPGIRLVVVLVSRGVCGEQSWNIRPAGWTSSLRLKCCITGQVRKEEGGGRREERRKSPGDKSPRRLFHMNPKSSVSTPGSPVKRSELILNQEETGLTAEIHISK